MTDLSRLDWNLVPVLDALLTERNVSRAADRLGVTQPSVSGSLARLRRRFGDDLLVRHGRGYELSPLAERLAPLVRDAVASTTLALASAVAFDPAVSERHFTVAASDYVQLTVGGALHGALARSAPRTRLELVSPFAPRFRDHREVLTSTDGWIAPREMLPGEARTGALSDRWVCVVDRDHPGVGEQLTMEDVLDLEWVAPTVRGELLRLQRDGLSSRGVEPRVAVTTDSFAAVPFLVAGTRRVGLVQASLAHVLADLAGVRVLECPWAVQALQITFWWDRARRDDPAHRWLRQQVALCLGVESLPTGADRASRR